MSGDGYFTDKDGDNELLMKPGGYSHYSTVNMNILGNVIFIRYKMGVLVRGNKSVTREAL